MGTPPSCAPMFASFKAAIKPKSVSMNSYKSIMGVVGDAN